VFVEEYLTCWNASEAARRAGYKGQASSVGAQLLANISIQEAIKARLAEKAMTADEVLVRLAEHARGSMAEFVRVNEDTGAVWLDMRAAQAAGKLHLIKSYQEASDKFGAKLELYDAQAALALLGKHHKLFTERTEHDLAPDLKQDVKERIAQLIARQAERSGQGGDPGPTDG
jgi:phage terminase small subunit